jgi:hypothetical protein
MRKTLCAGLVVVACLVALLWAIPSAAQHRAPGPAPAHGPVYGARPGGPHFSVGFYYGPYYGPLFYSPWFYSGFWGYPPYGYPYYWGAAGANVRIQVQPKSAEVYVDGYLAGIVDQFDGMFQSMLLAPGSHDITVYQEGYRSIVKRLYLSVGSSYKIKGVMEKLAPGEPIEPRPTPAAEPAQPQYQHPQTGAPPTDVPPIEPSAQASADSRFGQVAIRVQPADAQVIIDGETWKGPQGAERLVVHLPAGTHRIEIRKEGFDQFVTAVEVRRGEVAVVNVSLSKL